MNDVFRCSFCHAGFHEKCIGILCACDCAPERCDLRVADEVHIKVGRTVQKRKTETPCGKPARVFRVNEMYTVRRCHKHLLQLQKEFKDVRELEDV